MCSAMNIWPQESIDIKIIHLSFPLLPGELWEAIRETVRAAYGKKWKESLPFQREMHSIFLLIRTLLHYAQLNSQSWWLVDVQMSFCHLTFPHPVPIVNSLSFYLHETQLWQYFLASPASSIFPLRPPIDTRNTLRLNHHFKGFIWVMWHYACDSNNTSSHTSILIWKSQMSKLGVTRTSSKVALGYPAAGGIEMDT